MTYAWYDLLGTIGVAVIVLTYISLQFGRIRSEQLAYSIYNAFGALLILVSLYFSFNFSAFVVEFFWLLISIVGVIRFFSRKRNP